MLSYDIINVFIADGQKYSGNPLAVIYGAADLTQEQCQTLGRRELLKSALIAFLPQDQTVLN